MSTDKKRKANQDEDEQFSSEPQAKSTFLSTDSFIRRENKIRQIGRSSILDLRRTQSPARSLHLSLSIRLGNRSEIDSHHIAARSSDSTVTRPHYSPLASVHTPPASSDTARIWNPNDSFGSSRSSHSESDSKIGRAHV